MKNEEENGMLRTVGILSGLGIYFAVVVGICIFLGNLADEYFQIGYYGKLAGIIMGFPIAIYSTYRQLKSLHLND